MGKKKPNVKVKRDWSLAEKLAIVAESYEAGAVGVDVAERHGLTSSRLYGWRTELKEGRLVARDLEGPAFAAVVAAGSEDSRDPMIEIDLDHGVIRLPAHSPVERIVAVMIAARRAS